MNLPHEIIIELTNNCNLDCSFCFNKQGTDHIHEISQEDVFKILGDVYNSGIKAVRFTGGEPFLRKDLCEILKKAKSIGLYVILNTNAFLIDEKNKHCFKYVDLALFSLHDTARLEKVKEKMNLLQDYNLKIMLCTILTQLNINNLENYYDFISKLNNKNFVEWFLLRPIPNQFNKRPITKEDVKTVREKIVQYNNKYNLDIKIANALPFCAINEDLSSICKGGHFDSGYTRLVIDSNGNYKADYFSNIWGNINDTNILDIWNSDEMKDIRNYNKIDKLCKECYHLKKCRGGLIEGEYLYEFKNVSCLASVVIPTFNDSQRLSLLVKSLENQTINNFEVIVVDDGSTDDTKEVVEELKNKSHLSIQYFYLNNTDIFGAGIARNFGARKAKGNVLIFLDQDNVAHPKLIENYLREHKKKDIILGYYAGYGNQKYYYDINKLKSAVKKNKVIKTNISEFRKDIFNNPNLYKNQEWKFFVSANFSIKRTLFLKFLFDENIISWGGEDIDFGYRLIKKGYSLNFCRDCLTYNSSDKPFINQGKFFSLMNVLIYLFDKHNSEELKKYCFERFYHTPINLRSDSKLIEKNNKLIFRKPNMNPFDRDDVNKKNNTKSINTFCPKLWYEVYIDKNGDVYSCCHNKPAVLGNIYTKNLKEICNNNIIQELRKKSLQGRLDCYKDCRLHLEKDIPAMDGFTISYSNLKKLKILFSEKCNIDCIMCWQDSKNNERIDYKKLIENVDVSPFEEIEIQGGEPLFIKEAKKYFDYVTSKGKKVSFLTNGLLINEVWAKKIALYSSCIYFSLNAATKKTHESINRGSKWESVLGNIKKIKRYINKYNTEVKIIGHMTIITENLDEIPLFINNFKEFGFDSIEFGYDKSMRNYLKDCSRKKMELKSSIKSALNRVVHKSKINLFGLERIGLITYT